MDGVVRAASVDSVSPAGEILWWEDIIAISDGSSHTLGLRADGTVVATGDNDGGQCDVNSLTGIVAISAGALQSFCLKEDGTMVTAGWGEEYMVEVVADWKDIAR